MRDYYTCGICGAAWARCDCEEYAKKGQFSPNCGRYGPRWREWYAEHGNVTYVKELPRLCYPSDSVIEVVDGKA